MSIIDQEVCRFTNKVDLKATFGTYGWCGNLYDGESSGFYLSIDPDYHPQYPSCYQEYVQCHMIDLNISLDPKLFQLIDLIEILDNDGFCVHFTDHRLKSIEQFCFCLRQYHVGHVLRILYHGHGKLIFQEQITLPQLLTYGDTSVLEPHLPETKTNMVCPMCPICLEQIRPETHRYISACGHPFHEGCLWTYLEKNGYVKAMKCHHCDHSRKIRPFPCPMCRTLLENRSIGMTIGEFVETYMSKK